MYSVPAELRYTSAHEWARLDPDGRVVVGITDFAQQNLGDIVYVQIPDPGADVRAGAPMGEVESPKTVSDIYSPVTGRCVESNSALADSPELINQDPYGKGWLISVQPADLGELESLMPAAEYEALVQT